MRAARLWFVWAALALLIQGCSPGVPVGEADEQPPERQPAPPVPDEVSRALLPDMDNNSPRAPGARRFDIRVDNVTAQTFFMGLVRDTPYNMAVHPDVTGRISINLVDVTVPEVMEIVQDMYGYDYRRTRSGYMVMPATMQTRVFDVNYLNVKRAGRSETRVSSGAITDTQPGRTAERLGQPVGAGMARDSQRNTVATGTQIQTETESEFWRELGETLRMMVGSSDGRQVVVSPEAGLVVARAMPDELRELGNFISRMQDNLYRQVILEARIIEVRLSDRFQSGINWSHIASGGDLFVGQMGTEAPAPGAGTGFDDFLDSDIGGGFGLATNSSDFSSVVQLLSTQGDVQVLSSPRVSTVNNQKAVIKVGEDEFFVTGVDSATTTATATTTQRNVQLTPFFSGIALDVTPQINANGEVILHVNPSVSEVVESVKSFTIAGQVEELPLALSNVRETDSIVRARSGQVVVIGGLMQDRTEDRRRGVPVLSQAPVIGGLFRQTDQITRKSELVILLRPIVVDSDAVWERELERGRRSLGESWPEDF